MSDPMNDDFDDDLLERAVDLVEAMRELSADQAAAIIVFLIREYAKELPADDTRFLRLIVTLLRRGWVYAPLD